MKWFVFLLLLMFCSCTKVVKIKTYNLDNGTWVLTRQTEIRQKYITANVRFIDRSGPVEIEPLIKKDDEFSFWNLTKGLWETSVEVAKDTLHFNVGDTESDKTIINVKDK